jgi:hypothetical protein
VVLFVDHLEAKIVGCMIGRPLNNCRNMTANAPFPPFRIVFLREVTVFSSYLYHSIPLDHYILLQTNIELY